MARSVIPPTVTKAEEPVATASQWRKIVVVAIAYLAAVAALFLIENAEMFEVLPAGKSLARSVERFGTLYELQMKLVPRPLESHYVSLVDLGSDQGPCENRRRVTDTLPKMVAGRPAMIVSDIGFAAAKCANETETTARLINALRDAARTTPLVIPELAESLDEMTDRQAEHMRRKGLGDNDLLGIERVAIPDTKDIVYGVLELNADLRKVPVRWAVRETPESTLNLRDSLAFAAAKLYRRNFPDQGRRLTNLASKGYHPFTSLLAERDFSVIPVSGIDNESAASELRGRIVILGFGDDLGDQWNTYVGKLPGYVLQANYIEALLDARAFRTVSFPYQFLIGALWFGIVELPFWFQRFSTIGALVRSVALSLTIMFVLYYVLLVNLGWYISAAPPSALAIAGRVLYQTLERRARKAGTGGALAVPED